MVRENRFKLPGFPLFVLVSTFIALLHEPDESKDVEAGLVRTSNRRVVGR